MTAGPGVDDDVLDRSDRVRRHAVREAPDVAAGRPVAPPGRPARPERLRAAEPARGRGPSTIAQLTAATGLDASTLNRQTAALRTAGLAERFEDPDGGPARKLRLSEHGRRMLDEERRASRDSLAELVTDWSEEDRARFAELLARCNRAVEERSGRYWPRP
nr:hypothetical protein GCM10025730_53000 [Promicromonospora thailandica]